VEPSSDRLVGLCPLTTTTTIDCDCYVAVHLRGLLESEEEWPEVIRVFYSAGMDIMEPGYKMLGSSGTQYLNPDYIQPLPTTVSVAMIQLNTYFLCRKYSVSILTKNEWPWRVAIIW